MILRWMFKLLISRLRKNKRSKFRRNELQKFHTTNVHESLSRGGFLLIQNCTQELRFQFVPEKQLCTATVRILSCFSPF